MKTENPILQKIIVDLNRRNQEAKLWQENYFLDYQKGIKKMQE